MDILLGIVLIAVCLAALWFIGYKGLLPQPYDKWAMAIAVALGTGGLWVLGKKPAAPKTVEPVVLPDPLPPTVIEVPSKKEVDHVGKEAQAQDQSLEEIQNAKPVETDDRGTDSDSTANALLGLGAVSDKPKQVVDLSK